MDSRTLFYNRNNEKKSRSNNLGQTYKQKNPYLNYSSFGKKKAQFVDLKGREYIAVSSIDQRDIEKQSLDLLDSIQDANKNKKVFSIRIPIHLRDNATFPSPTDEKVTLYDVKEQQLFVGVTDGSYHDGPFKKTGLVILRDFVNVGKVADPSQYEKLIIKKSKDTKQGDLITYKRQNQLNKKQELF
jgi:hypothetical protein